MGIDEQLLVRVADRARAEGALPDPATPDQLHHAERQLGFGLPAFLRALYERVADGRFGPGRSVARRG